MEKLYGKAMEKRKKDREKVFDEIIQKIDELKEKHANNEICEKEYSDL